jgi:hypothetical protein
LIYSSTTECIGDLQSDRPDESAARSKVWWSSGDKASGDNASVDLLACADVAMLRSESSGIRLTGHVPRYLESLTEPRS